MEFLAGAAGDFGGGEVELVVMVLEVEFGEYDAVCAEGVGFDGVASDVEEAFMDFLDGVWSGLVEYFGAVFESAVVVEREVKGMEAGAHGTVEDEDALVEQIEKPLSVFGHNRGLSF